MEVLRYLRYEDSNDRLSLPIRIRERHLTPDADEAILQAVGPYLQVAIGSDRDGICLRVPLRRWVQGRPYRATMSGDSKLIIAVGRFEDYLDPVPIPGGNTGGYIIPAVVEVVDDISDGVIEFP